MNTLTEPVLTRITQAPFGLAPDGAPVRLFTLRNRRGMVVKITDFGAAITSIMTPDRYGIYADVVLGFDTLKPYFTSPYFGATIGRYGNRIARGRFALDGVDYQLAVNDGNNHLHGGPKGFHAVVWKATQFDSGDAAGLMLKHTSPDGDQGYPGKLTVTVIYMLTDNDELTIRFQATTDRATPVNLTNHTYFNLAGDGDILDHELTIDADAYTAIDGELIPTGALTPVAGTPFDFRRRRQIGERIAADDPQLGFGSGYDHNFVLNKPGPKMSSLAARVCEPVSGRVLEVWSQEPGLQFYSGNFLNGAQSNRGRTYRYRGGFCLEPQHFPDSPNRPDFPDAILRPGQDYATSMSFRFSVKQ